MGGATAPVEEKTEQDSDEQIEPGQQVELDEREDTANAPDPEDQGQEDSKDSVEAPTDLPEGWEHHPSAIEAFDQARDEGISETQSGKDKELRKLEANIAERERVAANEAVASGVVEKVAGLIADVNQKLIESGVSEDTAAEQLARIFKPYEPWAKVFSVVQGRTDAAKGFTDGAAMAAKALTQGNLPKAISDELAELQDELADKLTINKTPGLTPETALAQIRDRRDELMRADATAKNESKTQHRQEVTENLSNRGKPPAGVGGRGKTRGPDGLTREKIEEMSPEAIARIPLEDLDRAMNTT